MKRYLSLIAIFFLLSACSDEIPPRHDCGEILWIAQPDNLVEAPEKIKARCGDFRDLNSLNFGQVWRGWEQAPTDLLIIDEEFEFLFTNDQPPEGFNPVRHPNLYARPRVLDPNLKATFPAFSATPVIIIGVPTKEEIESMEWTSTLWHEHFHQFQMSRPGYGEGVEALGLSGGDQTGMWMLNYPFPYEDATTNTLFGEMSEKLLIAYRAIDTDGFEVALEAFLAAKQTFRNNVGADNYRYFQFQIWQEGLARYTELAAFKTLFEAADLSGGEYPFGRLALALEELSSPTGLKDQHRVAFYSFGMVEGLVLDAANRKWKEKYFEDPFQVDNYYN